MCVTYGMTPVRKVAVMMARHVCKTHSIDVAESLADTLKDRITQESQTAVEKKRITKRIASASCIC